MVTSINGTEEGLKGAIKKLEEFRAEQEIVRDIAKDIKSNVGTLAKNMGLAADFSGTTLGKFTEFAMKAEKVGKDRVIGLIANGFGEMLNPLNLIGSALDFMIKKLLELDKAAVELKVATGFTNDFRTQMVDLNAEMIQFGIKSDVSAKALGSVVKSIQGANLRGEEFIKMTARS